MKVKCLLYTTKQPPYLYRKDDDSFELSNKIIYEGFDDYTKYYGSNNGKIVAECEYELEKIFKENGSNKFFYTRSLDNHKLEERSCLSFTHLKEYLSKNVLVDEDSRSLREMIYNGHAIHIKNLNIFDRPKELKECHKKYGGKDYSPTYYMPITKAPQNMMKVWLYENGEWVMYILISIQSEWMCKILNREKDVEVRKKILKEMLENV